MGGRATQPRDPTLASKARTSARDVHATTFVRTGADTPVGADAAHRRRRERVHHCAVRRPVVRRHQVLGEEVDAALRPCFNPHPPPPPPPPPWLRDCERCRRTHPRSTVCVVWAKAELTREASHHIQHGSNVLSSNPLGPVFNTRCPPARPTRAYQLPALRLAITHVCGAAPSARRSLGLPRSPGRPAPRAQRLERQWSGWWWCCEEK